MDIPPLQGSELPGSSFALLCGPALYSPCAGTQSTASGPPVMSLRGQSPHRGFNLRMLQVYLSRASDEANLLYLSLASRAATVLKQETPLQKTFCLTLKALHVPMSPALPCRQEQAS